MIIIFLLLILIWFLSWWLWLFKQARQIKNPQKRLICVSLCVFLCVSLCVIPIFLHYSPMRIRAMSSFLSVMSIFAIVCWVWGWIYLFRQAKQIKNESEYFKYGSLSIISLTLPLVLLFYLGNLGETTLTAFSLALPFLPFWFRSPSDTRWVRRFISCFVFYLPMYILVLIFQLSTCCTITYAPDYVRQILPLLTIFWCLAWFWLFVKTKSIVNKNDKGFKRWILLVIFLCFCYFTAFIVTALNASTSGL